jgi:hypothetical protein
MVADPRIFVEGPYPPGGGSPTGPETPLYLTSDSSLSTSTDTEREDVPTQDEENSLLSPISGEQTVSFSGVIEGDLLKKEGFGSTPEEAFRNYVFELETLVSEEQGNGFRVEDLERGKTFDPTNSGDFGVLFDSFRLEYQSGEGVKGEWNLDGQVTDGVQNAVNRSNKIRTEKDRVQDIEDKVVAAGTTVPLGEVEKRTRSREVDLNTSDIIHNEDSPNVAAIDTGVKGNVTFEGRITDHQVQTDLSTLANRITDSEVDGGIHGAQAELYEALTGRIFSGAITDSNADFEAGQPNRVKYRIELEVGEVAATA